MNVFPLCHPGGPNVCALQLEWKKGVRVVKDGSTETIKIVPQVTLMHSQKYHAQTLITVLSVQIHGYAIGKMHPFMFFSADYYYRKWGFHQHLQQKWKNSVGAVIVVFKWTQRSYALVYGCN